VLDMQIRPPVLVVVTAIVWLGIASSASAGESCVWTQSLGRPPAYLYGIDARTSRDVWAVGPSSRFTTLERRPRLEHWNGSSWRRATAPRLGDGSAMQDVSFVTGDDVWAVGSARRRAAFLHWNGTAWRAARSPAGAAGKGGAGSVAAVSSDDVWAVGNRHVPAGLVARVWHWDGTAWAREHLGTRIHGFFIDVESHGGRVTALGEDSATGRAFIVRLDASRMEQPLPTVQGDYLLDRDRGVVVGSTIDARTPEGALILQRTGGSWGVAELPELPPLSVLSSVAVVHRDDAFAFGWYPTYPTDPDHSDLVWLVLHWDGSSWSQVAGPGASGVEQGQPLDAAVSPTNHEVWVAGQIEWEGAVVRGC
jgi:hypothetical protein